MIKYMGVACALVGFMTLFFGGWSIVSGLVIMAVGFMAVSACGET